MIKKLLFASLLFLAFTTVLCSQNLIPNPSFEDVNVCRKYHEECSPKAWRSTMLKNFAYREYLGKSKQSFTRVKRTIIIPPDGSRYVAIRVFNKIRENDRTFIQAPILCDLEAGQLYQISFQYYVSTYVVGELSIAMVDTMQIFKKNKSVLEIEPQIKFQFDKKVKPEKWHTAKTTFIATGSERGLIIGNFNSDSETVLTSLLRKKEKNLPLSAHYVLDNFSLIAIDSIETDSCDIEKNRQFIYSDSTRHIIHEKIRTLNDLPIPEASLEVPDQEVIETPIEFKTEESLFIGEQTIQIKEDFVFSNITFENNQAVLKSIAFRPLEDIGQFLNSNPKYRLQITGHTDKVGGTAFNQQLSTQRAQAVADFLIRYGIHRDRLLIAGKGELEPLSTNETEQGRQTNRRVAFKLLEK